MNKNTNLTTPVADKSLWLFSIIHTSLLVLPAFAHAATFGQVVGKVVDIIDGAAGFLITLAVFFTAYAVFKYLIAGAESTKKGEAATMIMWGVIGIFAIVSMWGIVFVVSDTFFSRGDLSAPSSPENLIDPRLRN
jgi:hypothetical protein